MTRPLLAFLLISISAFAAPEKTELDGVGLKEVSINNSSGKVMLSATKGVKIVVIADKKEFSDQCRLTIERKGDELEVANAKIQSVSNANCEVDFEIQVPKAVNTKVLVGSGKADIKGTRGELAFKVGHGEVKADGQFNKIDGHVGAGSIEVKGLSGSGELKTGQGPVNLTFAKEALKGDLEIRTGTGDAVLNFPKGAKVKASYEGGMGKLFNELGDSAKPDYKVSMKSGMGNMTVKSY